MLVAKMESSQQHPHVHAWTVAVSVYRFPRAPHPPTHPPTHPTRARARVRARAHTQATASPRPQIKTVHCVILSARFWSVFGCKKKSSAKEQATMPSLQVSLALAPSSSRSEGHPQVSCKAEAGWQSLSLNRKFRRVCAVSPHSEFDEERRGLLKARKAC